MCICIYMCVYIYIYTQIYGLLLLWHTQTYSRSLSPIRSISLSHTHTHNHTITHTHTHTHEQHRSTGCCCCGPTSGLSSRFSSCSQWRASSYFRHFLVFRPTHLATRHSGESRVLRQLLRGCCSSLRRCSCSMWRRRRTWFLRDGLGGVSWT